MSRSSYSTHSWPSSTSRGQRAPMPPPIEEIPRFTSKDNQDFYEHHRSNMIIIEKRIGPTIDWTFQLTVSFETLGGILS